MINPFRYGGVVGKDAFCNRKRELADLSKAMVNGERLFVYSERRMGKTSLIRLALKKLPKNQFLSAYIDLWPTDGEESFATTCAKAIAGSMSTTADRMLQAARQFFGRLTPSVSADSAGNPQISFELGKSGVTAPALEEVLAAPGKIAAKRNITLVIVFDEFQRILEYRNDSAERSIRSAIQNQQEVSYIFLGSRKHLIQKMFVDRSRPLYRAGGHYPLGPIEAKDWLPFIRERFTKYDKEISDNVIRSICQRTGGHPFYTQHLCHAIWELCETGTKATVETIDSATRLLLDRENYAYTALWESLGMNQRRFLIGIAGEPEGVKVFAADFLQRYNLRSPGSVQRAVETLLDKDVIDRSNGSFVIIDRFFKIWINQAHLGM
ncbi:MAG: ATP-binding protein [Deltaproteobacteria bacterium]|jgi:hypothetical protein